MKISAYLCLAIIPAILACSQGQNNVSDLPANEIAGNDTHGADETTQKDNGEDVVVDQGNPQFKCPSSDTVFGNIFSIDPAGPDTQIHAAAAWDGKGIWVAYNLPGKGDKKGFDVWVVRLACDGTHIVEPFMVNHESKDNYTDPSIAINHDIMMVAWQADNGQSPDNLSVWYRSFHIDGSPLMKQDRKLDLTNTVAANHNALAERLAPLPGDRFALTAAVGAKGFKSFQVWLQTIDKDGNKVGQGLLPAPHKGIAEMWPVVASDPDYIYLSWQREQTDANTNVTTYGVRMLTSPLRGTSNEPSGVIDPYPGHQNQAPDCASATQGKSPWLVFQSSDPSSKDSYIVIENARNPSGTPTVIKRPSGMNHTPAVATVQGGGAVAWYKVIQGIRNEVWFQEFKAGADGSPVLIGKPVKLNHNPAAPYPPAIAALPDGYFVAWSEGTSPRFRINAVFVHRTKM